MMMTVFWTKMKVVESYKEEQDIAKKCRVGANNVSGTHTPPLTPPVL